MAQTNILLEAGTNELEVVEFYLDELAPPNGDPAEGQTTTENPDGTCTYRGYYGVNVAKVLEIIRMPKVTELPEVQHPSVLGAFNLRSRDHPSRGPGHVAGKTARPDDRRAQDHRDGVQQRHHGLHGLRGQPHPPHQLGRS